MVKRKPTNTVCEMKVKELREYAKRNDVPIKDENGKLKLKCDLVIDTIKNISTNTINRDNSINRDNTINTKSKSKSKKSKSTTDLSKLSLIINELNRCLTKYYKENYYDEFRNKVFKPCCDENELNIIKECYEIFKENNSNFKDVTILGGIIMYYYLIVVLEYYASNEDKKNDSYNNCINSFYKYIENITNENPRLIINLISQSNEEYISKIRRKILGFNLNGGKHRISKKRRNMVKKRTKKNKSIRRFK